MDAGRQARSAIPIANAQIHLGADGAGSLGDIAHLELPVGYFRFTLVGYRQTEYQHLGLMGPSAATPNVFASERAWAQSLPAVASAMFLNL